MLWGGRCVGLVGGAAWPARGYVIEMRWGHGGCLKEREEGQMTRDPKEKARKLCKEKCGIEMGIGGDYNLVNCGDGRVTFLGLPYQIGVFDCTTVSD